MNPRAFSRLSILAASLTLTVGATHILDPNVEGAKLLDEGKIENAGTQAYEDGTLRLPKAKDEQEMAMHACLATLARSAPASPTSPA